MRALLAAAGSVAALGSLLLPSLGHAQVIEPGHVATCFEAVPAAAASPIGGSPLDLRVHVVLDDGVTIADGRRTIEKAQEAYTRLGLRLVPSFTTTSTTANDAATLFRELRGLFGGVRPPWAHVVYLMTRRDITDGAAGSAVAGKADCIGGVAFPEGSFAIGEFHDEPENTTAVFNQANDSARIAGHEIAHLFGAHHHYANCAEGALAPDLGRKCTLMFNDIALEAFTFSTANASIVRGHAVTYLEPVTAAAPPDGSVSVPPPPEGRECTITAYRDVPGDHAAAGVENPDDVDLLGGSFNTGADGVLRFRWKLASLDGDFGPGAPTAQYWLYLNSPRATIRADWDGVGQPTAEVVSAAGRFALSARVTTGDGGVIEVELPLSALDADSAGIELGDAEATYNDSIVQYDYAEPLVKTIEPGTCPVTPPAKDSPKHPVTPARAAPLRVEFVGRTTRRPLRVRLFGRARDIRLRLSDRSGRVVAAGRASRIDGRKTIRLRTTRRRLRSGTYMLRVTAEGRLAASQAIRLRAPRQKR